jgi:hypothetical protein
MREIMENKRKDERKKVGITTIIKRPDSGGGYSIMEFRSIDLSLGGVFISTEDLSIFELGEEVEILVDTYSDKLYEGRARVVRSARIFSEENEITDSGFGLMFQDPDSAFSESISSKLDETD